MTPRSDDTFASRLRITPCKRAGGDCKYGISREAEKFLTHANEPLYRFEVKAVEDLEKDGVYSRRGCSENRFNPLVMEDERSFVDDHTTFRVGASNRSIGLSTALGHDSAPKAAAAARKNRLAVEPVFADLCAHVAAEAGIAKRVNAHSSHMAETLKWDA